jgi:hypothetical protein
MALLGLLPECASESAVVVSMDPPESTLAMIRFTDAEVEEATLAVAIAAS